MLLNNDSTDRWVNGTIGHILALSRDKDGPVVTVRLRGGATEEVRPHTWEITRPTVSAGRLTGGTFANGQLYIVTFTRGSRAIAEIRPARRRTGRDLSEALAAVPPPDERFAADIADAVEPLAHEESDLWADA